MGMQSQLACWRTCIPGRRRYRPMPGPGVFQVRPSTDGSPGLTLAAVRWKRWPTYDRDIHAGTIAAPQSAVSLGLSLVESAVATGPRYKLDEDDHGNEPEEEAVQ